MCRMVGVTSPLKFKIPGAANARALVSVIARSYFEADRVTSIGTKQCGKRQIRLGCLNALSRPPKQFGEIGDGQRIFSRAEGMDLIEKITCLNRLSGFEQFPRGLNVINELEFLCGWGRSSCVRGYKTIAFGSLCDSNDENAVSIVFKTAFWENKKWRAPNVLDVSRQQY